MNRREVLSRLGLLFGGTIIGGEAFLSGSSINVTSAQSALNSSQIKLMNEFGETILPKTPESDGAKAAQIGEFINIIVTEFYSSDERKIFLEGLTKIENSAFLDFSDTKRVEFVLALENEAKDPEQIHSYLMIKQLTIWGYMTSEIGMTQLFDFAPVPGFYDGDLDYKPGDKVMNPRVANWEARNFATFHSRNQK